MTGCRWLEKMAVLGMSTEQHTHEWKCARVCFPPQILSGVFFYSTAHSAENCTRCEFTLSFMADLVCLHLRSHAIIYKNSDTQVLQTMGKRKYEYKYRDGGLVTSWMSVGVFQHIINPSHSSANTYCFHHKEIKS